METKRKEQDEKQAKLEAAETKVAEMEARRAKAEQEAAAN
jgi:hypothetical protein